MAIGDEMNKWAREDSNNPTDCSEKPHTEPTGAAKSAADSGDLAFAEAIRAVMALPGLTEDERAEAIRRLLNGKG